MEMILMITGIILLGVISGALIAVLVAFSEPRYKDKE